MDELRKKVIDTFWKFYDGNLPPDEFADEIFAQFEEKGWKSGEEVESLTEVKFVRHIENHLSSEQEVICKICDKTITEIGKEEPAMNLEKIYYDMEGKKRNILEMVKLYPEWAADMIQKGVLQLKEDWKPSTEGEAICDACGKHVSDEDDVGVECNLHPECVEK